MEFGALDAQANATVISRHAETRLRQRGFRDQDVEVVLVHGTPLNEATVLTDADVASAVAAKKREIHDLERLRGTAVILADGVVASVYRPSRRRLRRFMGRGRRPGGEGR
jgi:hypothetical protein